MKIINLKILNEKNIEIQNIDFNLNGISYIYADIQKDEKGKNTVNSLGKSLLLKYIDYIFGANKDSTTIKKELYKYTLKAKVMHNENIYIVTRKLDSDNPEIHIDNQKYDITQYRDFFNISRSLYRKQIILTQKNSEISESKNPNQNDIISCLELLKLNKIIDTINKIYSNQDKYSELQKNKKQLLTYIPDLEKKEIEEDIFIIDKDVQEYEEKLSEISKNIKTLKISNIKNNIIEEYAEKNKSLKELKSIYEGNRLEKERLENFIKSFNKIDVKSDYILSIFEKTKQEIPEMVKKTINEVELFHKNVFEERTNFLKAKEQNIYNELLSLSKKIETLSLELDEIGNLISKNKIYQESIDLYKKYNDELNNLKYKQGELSQIKKLDYDIKKINEIELVSNFNEAQNIIEQFETKIKKYQDFLFTVTKNIYEKDVKCYFNIKIRKKHAKTRPVIFEFSLTGDTGEGVGTVKSNLFDLLLLKFNNYSEILIQDSSCYSGGIDPRQIVGILKGIESTAIEEQKQVIISINKYQLGNNSEFTTHVKEKSVITLFEGNYLMGFEF